MVIIVGIRLQKLPNSICYFRIIFQPYMAPPNNGNLLFFFDHGRQWHWLWIVDHHYITIIDEFQSLGKIVSVDFLIDFSVIFRENSVTASVNSVVDTFGQIKKGIFFCFYNEPFNGYAQFPQYSHLTGEHFSNTATYGCGVDHPNGSTFKGFNRGFGLFHKIQNRRVEGAICLVIYKLGTWLNIYFLHLRES